MLKRLLHKIFFISIALLSVTKVYAVAQGFYLGVMAGPGNNNAPNQFVRLQSNPSQFVLAKARSQEFASRFFIGYMFNPWAGIEAGGTYFSSIRYNTNSLNIFCGSPNVIVTAFDVVGKFSLAFYDYFDVYLKAGAAYVYQSSAKSLNSGQFKCGQKNQILKFAPTWSIGASYYFNQSWLADISMNSINAGGYAKTITYFALGTSYHFVDRYCGQFLCDD